jgi:hypothetical protein
MRFSVEIKSRHNLSAIRQKRRRVRCFGLINSAKNDRINPETVSIFALFDRSAPTCELSTFISSVNIYGFAVTELLRTTPPLIIPFLYFSGTQLSPVYPVNCAVSPRKTT